MNLLKAVYSHWKSETRPRGARLSSSLSSTMPSTIFSHSRRGHTCACLVSCPCESVPDISACWWEPSHVSSRRCNRVQSLDKNLDRFRHGLPSELARPLMHWSCMTYLTRGSASRSTHEGKCQRSEGIGFSEIKCRPPSSCCLFAQASSSARGSVASNVRW